MALPRCRECLFEFLVTGATERFLRIAAEFLDHPADHLDLVDIARDQPVGRAAFAGKAYRLAQLM